MLLTPTRQTGTYRDTGSNHSSFRGIRSHLYGIVGLQKQVPAADAAVDAAQGHVQAEGEEVAMVEVAHTVVQPGWRHVQFNTYVHSAKLNKASWLKGVWLLWRVEKDTTVVVHLQNTTVKQQLFNVKNEEDKKKIDLMK